MVVADLNEDSANQTLRILTHDLKGQDHMAAAVDVSSKESVEKLVTSIQVRPTYTQHLHFPTILKLYIYHVNLSLIHTRLRSGEE